jgi:hypothetical protein
MSAVEVEKNENWAGGVVYHRCYEHINKNLGDQTLIGAYFSYASDLIPGPALSMLGAAIFWGILWFAADKTLNAHTSHSLSDRRFQMFQRTIFIYNFKVNSKSTPIDFAVLHASQLEVDFESTQLSGNTTPTHWAASAAASSLPLRTAGIYSMLLQRVLLGLGYHVRNNIVRSVCSASDFLKRDRVSLLRDLSWE